MVFAEDLLAHCQGDREERGKNANEVDGAALPLAALSARPREMGQNGIASLATFLPSLAVGIRRLHDRDQTGWWILLGLIPVIGWIILIVWFCMRGTVGPNRFGPDPLQGMP